MSGNKLWAKREEDLLFALFDNYQQGKIEFDDICKVFPCRNRNAIASKLQKSGRSLCVGSAINTDVLKKLGINPKDYGY